MKKKLPQALLFIAGFSCLQFCIFSASFAQIKNSTAKPHPIGIVPADTIPAIVNYKIENNVVQFSSVLRPLRQIAGAPEPFYTYFWEFGDGQFSFEKEPQHVYPDSILYQARLFATNSYDDGKRPPTRPKPLKPGTSRPVLASNQQPDFFKSKGNIELKTNCMPKPSEDMMLVLGYRNKAENGTPALNGTIAILYNDKEFNKDNFELVEARLYNQEKKTSMDKYSTIAALKHGQSTPPFLASLNGPNQEDFNNIVVDEKGSALIKSSMEAFRKAEAWKFENLKTGQEKFLFLELKTTPEMIKDTNAVVKLTGMFIPDNPLVATEFFTMELQIVASHDPNKMMLRHSRMNYRFTGKNRKLSYKVRFQNTGKGPAKKVDVGVAISGVLDKNSVQIIDSKPKLRSCDSAYANQSCLDTISTTDSLHFIFKNIYLPGLQQKGVNDPDSTMGFIEYKIGFKDKPKKLPFKSGAAIVFDKNEPIYTNRAAGRYKMGLSPGIIAGYGFPFGNGNTPYSGQKNLTFGLSLAPYAPHRYYWQVELYMSTFAEKEYHISHTLGDGRLVPVMVDGKQQEGRVKYADSSVRIKVTTINIVPLQLRYNFNKYIGAGVGTLVALDIDKQVSPAKETVYQIVNAAGVQTELSASQTYDKKSYRLKDFQNTFFADIQVGKVHVGPSLGFRYLYTAQGSSNRLITYLTWKF
ncbi:PKD domain-containing protein [Pedobacter sp. MC2016-24]|uniref:PKD domain-containing protein n=1 Tax=Pedobacter sp. MC2016-24 TaxID=2780090 RepID=UPI001D1691F0|nr:PKD domain-containing protein [Pedobacter sp. MC2016-24]